MRVCAERADRSQTTVVIADDHTVVRQGLRMLIDNEDGLQVIAVSTTLLLYYFDFRREALLTALAQVAANGVLTFAIGGDSHLLGMGYTAACAVTCLVSLALLRRRMEGLLERTFQSQPFLSEDAALLGHV